ncbi:phage tail protein [Planococcus versutus]|uniref:Prophage tail endopeptidase domain-containing protein n=1 Tax=Planococcus versutus TaxID=1302659 RepID=A0A1B1S5J2_9BACL|nr:phage tail protein [Planococcus versutus]ANU28462.1 hypothetical protein I858_015845 [Planococcus versutus]
MLAIRDLYGEEYILTGASEIKRTRRVNGERELSLTIEKTDQNAHFFDDIGKLWRVIDFDREEYPVLIYRDIAKGDGYVRQVSCLHSFFDDMRNHVVYESFSSSKTFIDMMNFIFDRSGYTFNIVSSFYAKTFENFGDDYGLELFKTALERYEAEFTVDGKVVTLQKEIGETTDFQYRHKFNLESIERNVDALDFSTYGKAYGKNGLFAEYTSPLAALHGSRPIKAIRDERFTVYQSLFEKVKKTVDDSLKISLIVKQNDLRASGYNKIHPNEGDMILLIDERLDLKVDTRIVEITEYFHPNGTVLDCDVTLSNFSNIFEQQRRIHNATKTLADAIEGKRPLPFEALAYAVQQATTALQSAQTELTFPESGGILAIDKVNPNIMVLFNSAGIGVSRDGGQTFPEALTGYGINATAITSGTVNTSLVRLEGADGKIFLTGDEFKSTSLTDTNKFVRITPGNIDVEGGGLNVKRPDGYTTIYNGMSVYDVNIQAITVPMFHSAGVAQVQKGYSVWMRSRSTVSLDYNQYRFKHDSRYLKVGFRLLAGGSNRAHLEIWRGGVKVASAFTNVTDEYDPSVLNGSVLTVDMGVPDGQRDTFQIRMRSSLDGADVFAIVSDYWQEG